MYIICTYIHARRSGPHGTAACTGWRPARNKENERNGLQAKGRPVAFGFICCRYLLKNFGRSRFGMYMLNDFK